MTSFLRNSIDVIIFYHCVEYIKFDTCAKFRDHRSNNNMLIQDSRGSAETDDPTSSAKLKRA